MKKNEEEEKREQYYFVCYNPTNVSQTKADMLCYILLKKNCIWKSL